MKTNAISIANYFVDKAIKDKNSPCHLTLLRLVKYVYISYGLAMALLDKIILDERFDKVEAWKYGPVIPSVYHSFKHNQNNPITEKASILAYEDQKGNMSFETPTVKDESITEILDFVWSEYRECSITQLIDELHTAYSPWGMYYEAGKNVEIPHQITKKYYEIRLREATYN